MYRLDPGKKSDPVRRWALPDRAFFGHGACAILAGTYLTAPPLPGLYAERIIPATGFSGNHIYVTDGVIAFDYRGYSCRENLLQHHILKWSKSSGAGWACEVEQVSFDLLDKAELNAREMKGPEDYLHNPVTRARRFITRFDHDAALAVQGRYS